VLLLLLALLRAVLLLLLALLRAVLLRLMLRVCRILISSVAVLLTSCVIDLASTLAPPLPPCPAPAGTVREGELREGELRPIGSCAAGAAGSLTFSCTRCSLSVSLEQCCVSRFCSSLLWTISAASDASRSLSALLSCS
jgi:hypothetical protein